MPFPSFSALSLVLLLSTSVPGPWASVRCPWASAPGAQGRGPGGPSSAARPVDDFAAALARLGGPDLDERVRAQDELSALWVRGLQRQEFLARGAVGATPAAVRIADRLIERLDELGADACRRVSIVLAADDLLLGVAVRLAGAGEPVARQVGLDALRGQLERWSVSAFDEPDVAVFDPPRQELDMPRPILDRGGFHVALDPDVGGGVAAFDRLDRLAGGPLPVIVDPSFAERLVRRPSAPLNVQRVSGTWTDSLETLCLVHAGAYQLQGFRFEGETRPSDGVRLDALGAVGGEPADSSDAMPGRPPSRPWIHVISRGSTAMARPGRDVRERGGDAVVAWCLDVVREGNRVRQGAAARALAALDWPAALLWLEQRWMATGDVTALEGLLAAAARGRVAPTLQREDVVRSILAAVDAGDRELIALEAVAEAEAADAADPRRAEARAAREEHDRRLRRFAVGLAGLSPVTISPATGRAGAPLLDIVLDGFGGAPPSGRWLRLVMAEGLGLESGPATAAARSVLLGGVDGRSRRQALRALLVVQPVGTPTPLVLGQPGELFAANDSDVRGLGLELGLLGATTSESGAGWVVPLSADRGVLAELIVWGALLAPTSDAELRLRGAPPAWLIRAILASIRATEDTSFSAGPDPFARAGEVARGDLEGAISALLEWVEPSLSAAGSGPGDLAGLRRAALRAGLALPAARAAALQRARSTLRNQYDDSQAVEVAWLDLASLVGDEVVGAEALETLQQSLVDSLTDRTSGPAGTTMGLVRAAERAAWSLEAARQDAASESFQNALRRAATSTKHPLAQRFYQLDWPPERNVPPRDLERIEPVLR